MSTRRDFIAGAALGAASLALQAQETKPAGQGQDISKLAPPKKPVIVCKNTGMAQLDGAYELLLRGHDTLDACLFITRGREDDPNDTSVGLGGLPNEEGVVELDACVMHGPTRRAGAVGGVRNIKNVSALARVVMERTDHIFLVGEGAERFAVAQGFQRENLLTERARKTWLLWKESMSNQDDWGPGLSSPEWKPPAPVPAPPQGTPQSLELKVKRMEQVASDLGIEPKYRMKAIHDCLYPPKGTVHVSVVNEKGEMSGSTSTSGLAWKLPGRVGDSPIIGAGCYTDQDIGSAGAVGRGEENIRIAGAHAIVENMRHGMSPQEAGMDALKRIARNFNNDMTRLRFVDMFFFVLRKDGAYAGVGLWSQVRGKPYNFAVHDGAGSRMEPCVGLFQGEAISWPPAHAPAAGK
ncbi:MAG TPA: N(4)-(beta-N-acetylglucosaminyl)-L-asparaginase [Terriglobales bacterium]|nr:N(4)-(beta-N-acetylglucosaminyl)-L-asparaginase [Terriglobales bacterium]